MKKCTAMVTDDGIEPSKSEFRLRRMWEHTARNEFWHFLMSLMLGGFVSGEQTWTKMQRFKCVFNHVENAFETLFFNASLQSWRQISWKVVHFGILILCGAVRVGFESNDSNMKNVPLSRTIVALFTRPRQHLFYHFLEHHRSSFH